MLVLSRKSRQSVVVGGADGFEPVLKVTVLEIRPGRKNIVQDLINTGADSCLMLPINAKDVASMLGRAQAGNHPGRHTLDLERAQTEDRWRDDGGQG